MLFRDLDELFQDLHRHEEFLAEFLGFLILPRAAEGGEAGLQRRGLDLHVVVEALQFLGEAPHFFGVHDRLSHKFFSKGKWVKDWV